MISNPPWIPEAAESRLDLAVFEHRAADHRTRCV